MSASPLLHPTAVQRISPSTSEYDPCEPMSGGYGGGGDVGQQGPSIGKPALPCAVSKQLRCSAYGPCRHAPAQDCAAAGPGSSATNTTRRLCQCRMKRIA